MYRIKLCCYIMYLVSIHLPNHKNIDEMEVISVVKNHCNELKLIKSFEYSNNLKESNIGEQNIKCSLELNLLNVSKEQIDIIKNVINTRYHINCDVNYKSSELCS